MANNGKTGLTQCYICKRTLQQQCLKSHLRKLHCIGPYTCGICRTYKSETKEELTEHKRSKHNIEPINIYQCLFCDTKCAGFATLEVHMQCHTMERHYFCKVCPQEVSSRQSLQHHKKIHDVNRKPDYWCPKCFAGFIHRDTLKRHLQSHSTKKLSKDIKCKFCPKTFHNKYNLSTHLRTHTMEKPEVCKICKKRFSHRSSLLVHMRTHTGEYPYECLTCMRRFKDRSDVKKHTKRVHEKVCRKFQCRYCHRFWHTMAEKNRHEKIHVNEKSYFCNICGNGFIFDNYLKTHIARVHAEDRLRFACVFCPKRISHSGHLRMHLLCHIKEKPHFCKICAQEFSNNKNLREHLRKHG